MFAAEPPRRQSRPLRPRATSARGSGEIVRYAIAPCALGFVLAAQTENGVCAVALGDAPATLEAALRERFRHTRILLDGRRLQPALAAVGACIEDPHQRFTLPLDVRGTAFQRRVWAALCALPAGTTASYTEIARRIGAPTAVRAVAQACASNAIAVAIPCHRVIRGDGALSGYRWGVERKRALLEREKNARKPR